ncbi:MAG TPA: hypothetical protein VFJ04_08005 [Rhodanobacteraceae bacterium]|jgi:hypothetical protein|nr:hypothetical protein [Rhodanobacteraceae bacterium]
MRPRRAEQHEEAAVATRQVHRVGGGLALLLVFVLGAGYLLWRFWLAPVPPRPVPRADIPPAPLLQPHPAMDLAQERALQHARLHGYAWVDRKAGIARIPIDRAVALLEQGR